MVTLRKPAKTSEQPKQEGAWRPISLLSVVGSSSRDLFNMPLPEDWRSFHFYQTKNGQSETQINRGEQSKHQGNNKIAAQKVPPGLTIRWPYDRAKPRRLLSHSSCNWRNDKHLQQVQEGYRPKICRGCVIHHNTVLEFWRNN